MITNKDKYKYIREWLLFIIQFILLVMVTCYTIETQMLRKATEVEVDLLKTQINLMTATRLYAGFTYASDYLEFISNRNDIPNEQKEFYKDEQKRLEKSIKYYISVVNPTPNMALNVSALVYDSDYEIFIRSPRYYSYIMPGFKIVLFLTEKRFNLGEVEEYLTDYYGNDCDFIFDKLYLNTSVKHSYIAIIYQDIYGVTHLMKRPFEISGGTLNPLKPEFYHN